MTTQSTDSLAVDRGRINFGWLLRLRWAAVLGQLITVLFVWAVLRIDLPVGLLVAIIGFTAATNLGFWMARPRDRQETLRNDKGTWALGSIMTMDVVTLTAMLYLSGGVANPFIVFYLVNIALAAVLLSPRWSWFVVGLALACYTGLFAVSTEGLNHGGAGVVGISRVRFFEGMFVASAIAAATVVYFITRLTAELAVLDDALNQARQRKVRGDQLAGLATLAAGAAHELATPLSTIAIVAKELERELQTAAVSPDVVDDLRLIRSELQKCRVILDHMSADAGETMGEPLSPIRIDRLIDLATCELGGSDRVLVTLSEELASSTLFVPPRTLSQSIRSLVKNALDASDDDATIALRVQEDGDSLRISVTDPGHGIAPEELSHVVEPFYTTKEPGKGMGLGLFLARTVCERLGGRLEIISTVGQGTVATIVLPRLISASESNPAAGSD
jgi:two-component system sensor histidine kinase RegB